MAQEGRWLPGFNINVEEWDAMRQNYETLARSGARSPLAYAVFEVAVEERPAGKYDPKPNPHGEAIPGG